MTIGAGIALAAVWAVSGIVITHRRVASGGMGLMIIAAVIATTYICGVKP